ncbi:HNH nuclease, partial [Mycolicibacterium phlei]|nr:HNH nuclease [Mycolicibacterium phlei]
IAPDGSGVAYIEAQVLATDGDALDQRLDALAATVCEHDPRTLDQRRADAVGVIAAGGDRLGCLCER